MITAIIFIIVLAVLILVHEFGHFIVAKRAGMRVDEFGFGFPPRIWGIKKGETIYSINAIPFGGFVKIFGEDGEAKDNPGSFSSKPAHKRFNVVAAGVVMNFLLAAFLLMFSNFMGLRIGIADDQSIPAEVRDLQVQIIQVAKNSPADVAGLRLLDEIKGFRLPDGTVKNTSATKDVQDTALAYSGQTVTVLIKRGGQNLEKDVQFRKDPPQGQGAMGVALASTGLVSYPWYESIWRGVYNAVIGTFNIIIGFYLLFKTLIFNGTLIGDVSGPIGIATLTGQAARISVSYLIQFVALISLNLAVLNFIPFPALDGGRAVLLGIEKLRGKALAKKTEGLINSVGFSLLIALMIYVTIKDIANL